MNDTVTGISRRNVLRGFFVAGALVCIPACTSSKPTSSKSNAADKPGTDADIPSLTWALTNPVAGLDIATTFNQNATLVQYIGFEGLLTVDDRSKLQPLLAESWTRPDNKTLVFQIRQGVTFWDGTPMTTDDVLSSLVRLQDPKQSQVATYFGAVQSIKKTGANEITVALSKPDPMFANIVPLLMITPKALNDQLGSKLGVATSKVSTMGTGPYVITKFNPATGLSAERNDRYWGTKPHVKNLEFKTIENPQTLLLAIQSGEIDGVMGFSIAQSKSWDSLSDVTVQYSRGLGVDCISFGMDVAPFDDVHARRAFAHAADTVGYVKAFVGGHGEAAESLVSPAEWTPLASDAEIKTIYDSLEKYEFSLDAARNELAQSSHPNGFSVSIDYPSNNPLIGKVMVSLAQSLKQIGITLTPNAIDFNKYATDIYANKAIPLKYIGYTADVLDPANLLTVAFPSAAAVPNSFNLAHYKSPQMDQLLDAQAASIDTAERVKILAQIIQLAATDLPYLPLYFTDNGMAINKHYVYDGFNSIWVEPSWPKRIEARA